MKGQTVSVTGLTAVIPLCRMSESTFGLKDTILQAVEDGIEVILVVNNKIQSEREQTKEAFTDIVSGNFSIIESQLQSPGEARNLGIQACTTAYITFWDADDYPLIAGVCDLTNKLSRNPTKNYGLGSFEIVNTKKVVLSTHLMSENQIIDESIIRNPGIWRWIFRTEKIKGTEFQTFMMGEDQDFLADLNPQANEMIFNNVVTYKYVQGWGMQLTRNQRAIDDISLSLSYLFDKVKSKTGNHWHRKFLFRQLLTGVKRGSWKTKALAAKLFIKLMWIND
jgi:glycosyltransferase involved in cell wall biosynthesis